MLRRRSDEEEEDDCVLFDSSSDDEFNHKEVFCFSAPPRVSGVRYFSLFPMYKMPSHRCNLSVDDACKLARPGHLLLFNGCGTSSTLVRIFTPSRYSHVAIVCQMFNEKTKETIPFLIEAVRHPDDIADCDGEFVAGVRVVPMKERIKHYQGYTLAMRPLVCKKRLLKSAENFINVHLSRFVEEYRGRGYNHDWRDFFNARVPFFRNTEYGARFDKTDKRRQFFCSELIAQCFIEAGMLDGMAAAASSYSPDCFSSGGNLHVITPQEICGANLHYDPEMFVELPCLEKNKKNKK